MFWTKVAEKIKTLKFLFSFIFILFFENRAVFVIMYENGAQPDRPQTTM